MHRLQARTKLLMLPWLVIILLIANQREWHFLPYIAIGILLVVGIALAGIAPRDIWRRLRFLLIIALAGTVFTLFSSQGDLRVLCQIGPLRTSYAQIRSMLIISGSSVLLALLCSLLPVWRGRRWLWPLRLLLSVLFVALLIIFWLTSGSSSATAYVIGPLVVTYGSVWLLVATLAVLFLLYIFCLFLTMTTQPVALIEGVTLLLKPLRRLKLPVDDFALMTLLALRFIPTLLDEAEHLIKAQVSRGADVAHGSVHERLQSLFMFFVPFMQGALRRAADLSVALEARGYRVEGQQTLLYETSLGMADYLALGMVILITAVALLF